MSKIQQITGRLTASRNSDGRYSIWADMASGHAEIGDRLDFDSATAVIRWWREGGLVQFAAVDDGSGQLTVEPVEDISIVKVKRGQIKFNGVDVGPSLPFDHATAVFFWLASIR